MKYKVYTIFDMKVGAYMQPFFMRQNGEAIRAFTDLANDKSKTIGANPEDFSLYYIAEFDDESGLFFGKQIDHVCLGKAIEFVK